jgi:DNA repair photolyase
MPAGIAFGSTTDLFQPIDPLLAVVHEVLRVALTAGLEVHFQTRGLVPEGFGDLLSKHKGKVHAQVVLFAMHEGLNTLYEPYAPCPTLRLESIRRLISWGVDVQARIEPLIPFISDTAGPLEELVRHLRSAGVRRASAAYLVLQPQVLDRLEQHLPTAHFHVIKGSFRGQAWKREGVHSNVRMLPLPTREQGYQRLRAIARRSDLDLSVCACQDAALGSSCVAYSGAGVERKGQLDLFPTG